MEVQLPQGPGLYPWVCAFSAARGREGAEAREDEARFPATWPSAALPAQAACARGRVPGSSGPSSVLYEQGNVGLGQKSSAWTGFKEPLTFLKLYAE